MNNKWWKNAVVYQIYPRSFQDSNNDGIGDLKGIISRLDYLQNLGINAIWLSPVCKSPQDDNGYDISDYEDIDEMFGTLEDMDELIKEAEKRDIKIILDLVLNHSSDEHRWFKEAKKSKDNPYHDYYVWRDGVEGTYPNEMESVFGGTAWEWVPELKQYYLHQFSVKQPDLNWENEKVRREIYDMILRWMDKGVGGFRLDVIDQIAKDPELQITNNGPRLHEFITELSRETFQKGDIITVGEAWGADVERAKKYSNPDGSEFSMVFQFEHIGLDQEEGKSKWDIAPLSLVKLKKTLAKWQNGLYECGWNSLFWNNHDLPRIVSRWGNDKEYWKESAKMLATILHGMQGTPYIYQGEELGMTNVSFETIEQYKDIETLNMYKIRTEEGYTKESIMESIYKKGRDNARTPMQWSDKENAGFTGGKPWIEVNPNYKDINADAQINDPDSIFNYYKELIKLRKENEVFINGDFKLLLEEDENIFAYTRTYGDIELLMCANFTDKELEVSIKDEWISNHKDTTKLIHNYATEEDNNSLRPYEAYIYIGKKKTKDYVFGIDVGGTTIKFGLFKSNGSLIEKWERITNTEDEGVRIIPDISESIKDIMEKYDIDKDEIIGVGVGIPGPVMNEREVNMAVNLHWKHKNLADELEALLDGIPVKAGNDANVAALGEMWQGGGKGTENLIMVTLGTGVGGGVIIDGKIVTGAHGAGGEIGHANLVHHDKIQCNCGNKGCLETVGSATGIVNLAKKELESNDKNTVLRDKKLNAKVIFDAYKENDEVAKSIVEKFSKYLGNALAIFSCVIDPEVIVIGGGVSNAGKVLTEAIEKYYREDAFVACKETPIVLAKLGNDAGIYGAAKLAIV